MNMYAWSYAKLWCTALQATAGGVRHARHSNSSPRANNRPALGLPANSGGVFSMAQAFALTRSSQIKIDLLARSANDRYLVR